MFKPDFDAAAMMAAKTCCFHDCASDVVPGWEWCEDCENEISTGERGICDWCNEPWVLDVTACDCEQMDADYLSELEQEHRDHFKFLERWAR